MKLHPNQENVHPFASGTSYERFQLDRVPAQAKEFMQALRLGTPVIVNGRNITKEWEQANLELREHGGLAKVHTARDNYGWKSL